jgi:hypothetical protein
VPVGTTSPVTVWVTSFAVIDLTRNVMVDESALPL